jgi:hypothetical protein
MDIAVTRTVAGWCERQHSQVRCDFGSNSIDERQRIPVAKEKLMNCTQWLFNHVCGVRAEPLSGRDEIVRGAMKEREGLAHKAGEGAVNQRMLNLAGVRK